MKTPDETAMMRVYRDMVAALSPVNLHKFVLAVSAITRIIGRECSLEVNPHWPNGKDIYGEDNSVELQIIDGQLRVHFGGGGYKPGPTEKRFAELQAYCIAQGITREYDAELAPDPNANKPLA